MLYILTLIVTYQLLLKQSKFYVINICVIVTINRKIGNSRKSIFPLFQKGGSPPFSIFERRISAERRTKSHPCKNVKPTVTFGTRGRTWPFHSHGHRRLHFHVPTCFLDSSTYLRRVFGKARAREAYRTGLTITSALSSSF